MTEIIPAIMPESYEDLLEKVRTLQGNALSLQFDLMDGKFVQGKTWPFINQDFRRIEVDTMFELDLMVTDASSIIPTWTSTGACRLIFHIEAEKNLRENLEKYKEHLHGVEIGVASDDDFPIERMADFVPYVDFVQLMGIDEIGKQGEAFEPRVLKNLRYLREHFPDLLLSVDGSVNKETIPEIVNAGADRLVVGSAIFATDNPIDALQQLSSISSKNETK